MWAHVSTQTANGLLRHSLIKSYYLNYRIDIQIHTIGLKFYEVQHLRLNQNSSHRWGKNGAKACERVRNKEF